MNTVAEIWKAIPGFPGYEVSNLGNVRSLDRYVPSISPKHPGFVKKNGHIRKPVVRKDRYIQVKVNRKMMLVHRLVAIAFIGEIPDGMEVNHKNGNRGDNLLGNLEITTPLLNVRHAWETGLAKPHAGMAGETHPSSKLTERQVIEIRAITGKTAQEIANMYGVSRRRIGQIRERKCWKHI